MKKDTETGLVSSTVLHLNTSPLVWAGAGNRNPQIRNRDDNRLAVVAEGRGVVVVVVGFECITHLPLSVVAKCASGSQTQQHWTPKPLDYNNHTAERTWRLGWSSVAAYRPCHRLPWGPELSAAVVGWKSWGAPAAAAGL